MEGDSSRPLMDSAASSDESHTGFVKEETLEVDTAPAVNLSAKRYGIGHLLRMATWEWRIIAAALTCQVGQVARNHMCLSVCCA